MTALCALLFLFAPEDAREWSKAHEVGLSVPGSWKIVARDQGAQAFVIDGPRLGLGTPRLVLAFAGNADDTDLPTIVKQLVERVGKRPGWRVVSQSRSTIGAFPCVRVGVAFVEEGDRKGRARFTVALLGRRFFVLEMSAASAHFPGAIYDQVQKSLAVRWTPYEVEGGLVVDVPAGWKASPTRGGSEIDGPRLAAGHTILLIRPGDDGTPPKGAKPAGKVKFHGALRAAHLAERRFGRELVRMLHVHAGGWTAVFMAPAKVWEDVVPTAREVLATARTKKD